jgi:hypothetical protein
MSTASKFTASKRIAPKSVVGRRQLRYATLADMLADAERLVESPSTRLLGNWPLDKLLTHLATGVNASIDGIPARAPWFLRLAGVFLKRRFLTKQLSAGFKLPKTVEADFFPPADSPAAALAMLRGAVDRLRTERMTARHPVLGKLTHDEWSQLHLRHAELHLSFALPD